MANILNKLVWLVQRAPYELAHFFVCFVGCTLFTAGFGIGTSLCTTIRERIVAGKWSWNGVISDLAGTVCGGLLNLFILRALGVF